jgi:hypothetical protein
MTNPARRLNSGLSSLTRNHRRASGKYLSRDVRSERINVKNRKQQKSNINDLT